MNQCGQPFSLVHTRCSSTGFFFFFYPSKELAGFNKNTEKCVEKRTISKAIESRPHMKQMELLAAGSSNIITTRSFINVVICHVLS